MSENALTWREVDRVELHHKLVRHPRDRELAELRDAVSECRVAIEGAFLHIDPRTPAERKTGVAEWLTTVPAHAVKKIVWRSPTTSPPFVARVPRS